MLITVDLIGLDREFADAVCADICEKTGLERRQIVINASHTHAGPVFGYRYPKGYEVDPEEPGPVAAYNEMVRARLVQVAASALDDLGGLALQHRHQRLRDAPAGRSIAPFADPHGHGDEDVIVVAICDQIVLAPHGAGSEAGQREDAGLQRGCVQRLDQPHRMERVLQIGGVFDDDVGQAAPPNAQIR